LFPPERGAIICRVFLQAGFVADYWDCIGNIVGDTFGIRIPTEVSVGALVVRSALLARLQVLCALAGIWPLVVHFAKQPLHTVLMAVARSVHILPFALEQVIVADVRFALVRIAALAARVEVLTEA